MKKRSIQLAFGCVCLAVGLVGSLSAFGQEPGRKIDHHFVIRTHEHDCAEGEDCSDDARHGRRFFFRGPGNWAVLAGGTYLGVELTEMTPELRTHFGVPEDVGVLVARVSPSSPAESAGLEAGDIVTAVDGEDVSSARQLSRLIRGHEEGDSVVLDVWRDGRLAQRSASLSERDSASAGSVHRFAFGCDDGDDCGDLDLDFDFDFDFDFDGLADRLRDLHDHWRIRGDGSEHSLGALRHLGRLGSLGRLHDFQGLHELCPDGGACRIEVDCDDGGDCDCTVDGETVDCP